MEVKNLHTVVKVNSIPPTLTHLIVAAPVPRLHDRSIDALKRLGALQGGGSVPVFIRSSPLLSPVQKIFIDAGLTPPDALPTQNPITGTPADWSTTTDPIVDFMIDQANRQVSRKQIDDTERQNEKILHLLMVALQMGNIDLAMLLFATLESRQATEMTKVLTQKLVEAQENRRKLTGQMAGNDKEAQKNLAKTQANVQEVNDQISLLTSFIRDVSEQKNRTLEFANNFLINEHQTAMSIVRGMKG